MWPANGHLPGHFIKIKSFPTFPLSKNIILADWNYLGLCNFKIILRKVSLTAFIINISFKVTNFMH